MDTATETNTNIFADAPIIASYGRAQALEDGFLVELDPKLCAEAGFRCPVAVTSAVFAKVIELTPAAKRACNDVTGRTWDVLWMASLAARRNRGGSELLFEMRAVVTRVRASRVVLKMVVGPGDHGEMAITIMLPEED